MLLRTSVCKHAFVILAAGLLCAACNGDDDEENNANGQNNEPITDVGLDVEPSPDVALDADAGPDDAGPDDAGPDDAGPDDVADADADTEEPFSLGSELLMTFGVFEELPLTLDEAVAQGWINTDHCVPGMGNHVIRPVIDDNEVLHLPAILVYDIDGRLLGFEAESLTPQISPPWEHAPEGRPGREVENWTLHVYFRDPGDACEPGSGDDLRHDSIGDRLLVTHGEFTPMPLTLDEAVAQGWINTEHCVPGMGVHVLQLLDPENPAAGPSPFVLVFNPDNGELLGFELISVNSQPSPPWEYNPDGVGDIDVEVWTMHVYFQNPAGVCPPTE